jgi:hypothetical protein
MKTLCSVPLLTLAMAGLLAGPARAEILDRVAVVVDKQVITESQVIMHLRVGAFLDQAPVDLSGEKKREAAGRLVDQLLMLQEADTSHLELPTLEAAEALVDQVRAAYLEEGSFEAALARYQITERDVAVQLLLGLQTVTFMELRFRPGIQVTENELEAAYEELVPVELRDQPGGSFEENRRDLEQLLTDRQVDEALDEWLMEARDDIGIRYRRPVFR